MPKTHNNIAFNIFMRFSTLLSFVCFEKKCRLDDVIQARDEILSPSIVVGFRE
jgi:hypothetical protein